MEDKQNGIFIFVDSDQLGQCEARFSVKKNLPLNLALSDIGYVYAVSRGVHGGHFSEFLGRILRSTVEFHSDNQVKIYTFEFSQVLKGEVTAVRNISKITRENKDGDIFSFNFHEAMSLSPSDEDFAELLIRPERPDGLTITIQDAINKLANTYGVERKNITISVSG